MPWGLDLVLSQAAPQLQAMAVKLEFGSGAARFS